MRPRRQAALWAAISMLGAASAGAAPFALVTSNHDRTIHVLDLGTSPPMLSGPFFVGGELGSSGSILDVATFSFDDSSTPPVETRFALVSNFASNTVYRIDLTTPTAPTVAASVTLPFSPEDVAIAPFGTYAVVTGGSGSNQLAVLDLDPLTLTGVYTLTTPGAAASCVAISPDGQRVVLCDSANDRIVFGLIVPETASLSSESTLATGSFPVNAAFSPDGDTLLVANGGDGTVSVFEIAGSPGTLSAGTTPTVSGLPGEQQSIAFAPDGSQAFVLSEDPSPDQVSVLDVLGPGNVTLSAAGAADLPGDASVNLRLGVDALAVSLDGDLLLAANPGGSGAPAADLALVDLTTTPFTVSSAATASDAPAAVAVLCDPASDPVPELESHTVDTSVGFGTVTMPPGSGLADLERVAAGTLLASELAETIRDTYPGFPLGSTFGQQLVDGFGTLTNAQFLTTDLVELGNAGDQLVDSLPAVAAQVAATTGRGVDSSGGAAPLGHQSYSLFGGVFCDSTGTTIVTGSGEVDFFQVDAALTFQPADFGDAPAPYPTLFADGGAFHNGSGAAPGPSLGPTPPDLEDDGQPSAAATGDDTAGSADESPVSGLESPLVPGSTPLVTVPTTVPSGTAFLSAWIDFDRDGDWSDPGERIATDVVVATGSQPLAFAVPAGASAGPSFARFRISTTSGLGPGGPAPDGEVEDAAVTIGPGAGAPATEVPTLGMPALALLALLLAAAGSLALLRA